MDGSRRYSKIYCKTQAGADALTAGRGLLSSSARQLLILLDGERDFDELSRIFSEETLYRLLPFLESQGFVEPLNERETAQRETPAPPSTTRTGIPTFVPTTALPTAVPTVTQATVSTIAQVAAPPATLSEHLPLQPSAKSPRFLAVPIAILVSLATAAVIVNWVFEREQHADESAQHAQDVAAASATPATTAGKPPSSEAGSLRPSSGSQPAQGNALAENSESTHVPVAATPVRSGAGQPSSAEASSPAGEKRSPPALRGRTDEEPASSSTKAFASDKSVPSTEASVRTAPRSKVAISDAGLEVSKLSLPPAKTQANESSERLALRAKVNTESASIETKEPHANPDGTPATGQGTLAVATPDHATEQAPATVGLHVRTRVLPSISKRALDAGIYGGTAVVRLHINSAGAVERVELVSANPPEVYGPDVQHALEQWTFEPPSNPAQFTLDLDFRQQPPASPASASNKSGDGP